MIGVRLLHNLWTHRGDPRRPADYERRHGGSDAVVEAREIVAARRAERAGGDTTVTLPAVDVAPNDGSGAVPGWSPAAELAHVPAGEPEETPAEAVDREAEELRQHLAELDREAKEWWRQEWALIRNQKIVPAYERVEAAVDAALARLALDLQVGRLVAGGVGREVAA